MLSAMLMVGIFALTAFAIDIGYMMLVRTQLQAAADSGAMAAGNAMQGTPDEVVAVGIDYVKYHTAGGRNINDSEANVELGTWDAKASTFVPLADIGNAVRVTAKRSVNSRHTPG